MSNVSVLLIFLRNRELNRGPILSQVAHGSVLSGYVLLSPLPTPVAITVLLPQEEELRFADDVVVSATERPAEPPHKWRRLHGKDANRHQNLIKELVIKRVNDVCTISLAIQAL